MSVQIKAGFGRADITPQEYTTLAGNGNDPYRMCNNILDRIQGTCVAIQDEAGETVLLCTADLLNAKEETVVATARKAITEAVGVPEDRIMVGVTHTHAGPSFYTREDERTDRFLDHFGRQMAKAAVDAIADLHEAQIQAGQKIVKNMTFVRHYLMNDGTYAGPNFGSYKSGCKAHADVPDEQLQLIRFVRESARDIVLVNWQCHATITNGLVRGDLSADYPGAMRNHVEGSLGCHCAFFQGACGNLVPASKLPEEMIVEHDHILYGRKLAEFVMEGLKENMRFVKAGPVRTLQHIHSGLVDHSEDHRVPEAKLVTAGFYDIEDPKERRARLNRYGFNSYLHANQICNRSRMGKTLEIELDAISVGDIAFATAPYEMFNSNGRYVKDNSPFELTFMMAYCNGSNSYIADKAAFRYDCYEVNSRRYVEGEAEKIAETHVMLLNQLKEMEDRI